jgi:CelD/BcsL family acetyltransferase involved in cellulose biosynthesis
MSEFRIELVSTAEALRTYLDDWEGLTAAALEPNIFYEPPLLLPAIQELGSGIAIVVALVFVGIADGSRGRLLCGLFPFRLTTRFKHLPLTGLTLWAHPHCYLCTPLIRRGFAAETLDALLEWLQGEATAPGIMEFPKLAADGPVWEALSAALDRHTFPVWEADRWDRALFRRQGDVDGYLQRALPRQRLRESRRRTQRLAERGAVSFDVLPPGGEVGPWLEEFLALESSGWKGRAGTALACNQAEARFFVRAATDAFHRGQLVMEALRLDGAPIAMGTMFVSGPGGFRFKDAIDERYRAFSPGILLRIEELRRLYGAGTQKWVDSCTDPDNAVWNQIYLDRRELASVVFSTPAFPAGTAIKALPTLRALRRKASVALGQFHDPRRRPHDGPAG